MRASPDDAQLHVLYGLALAYLGKKTEAIREGERGVTLLPLEKDGFNAPYIQHQLVRIYILVGEPEKALDRLEPLLKIPYNLSPAWLKIDPSFDPLRKIRGSRSWWRACRDSLRPGRDLATLVRIRDLGFRIASKGWSS